MTLSQRELWTVIHGLVLGTVYLLAWAGGVAGLYSLRPDWVTAEGIRERLPRLRWGTAVMAVVGWLTCITGTFIVYPWYRATPPEGVTDLAAFPRSFLRADPGLITWHSFGMEWKEHVAWLTPILATAVAFVVWQYGRDLVNRPELRRALIWLFTLSFVAAGVAGLFGAFLNKIAPIR
jgi:hypothetical protein